MQCTSLLIYRGTLTAAAFSPDRPTQSSASWPRSPNLTKCISLCQKYSNTQIHKYTNTKIHKYTNTQILLQSRATQLAEVPQHNQVHASSPSTHLKIQTFIQWIWIYTNINGKYKVVSHRDFYVKFNDCPGSFFETFQEPRNGEHPPKPVCPSSQPRECAQLEDRHQSRLPLPRHHPIYCGWGKGDGDDWS